MSFKISRRSALAALSAVPAVHCAGAAEDLLPKHITPETVGAIKKGLEFLARSQASDGSWHGRPDGDHYPVAMTALCGMAFLASGSTSTRGMYADQIRRATSFIVSKAQTNGLIAEGEEQGRPMYGHGFGMLFLSTAFGMETRSEIRDKIETVLKSAISLTAQGQSSLGGWYYYPGSGDEGSVTVTQMQGLRAAHNAGFSIPKGTIEGGIRYLELCKTADGGICYSYAAQGDTRLPITAAAVCCLYSAGEYQSPLADTCLNYVLRQFKVGNEFRSGHSTYLHYYAAQAFYQAGDQYWDPYFPRARDTFIKSQQSDGSWNGDWAGNVFGTSMLTTVLQLPYKYIPVYQR